MARLTEADPDDFYCVGAFSATAASGFTDFDDAPAECSCTCEDPQGGSCAETIDVEIYNVTCVGGCNANYDACASLTDTMTIGIDLYMDPEDFGIRLLPPAPEVLDSPTCAPAASQTIPPPTVSAYVEACALGEPPDEVCESGDTCVPEPSDPFVPVLCIWAEGDEACPAGDYSDRLVLYGGLEDTRACGTCTCEDAADVACEGEISVRADYPGGAGPVMDPLEYFPANGECTGRITANTTPTSPIVNFVIAYVAGDGPTSTGCSPTGGEASGSVTGLDPVTLCCTPPLD